MKILAATNNAGKVREFGEILIPMGFEMLTPRNIGLEIDPEETGATFEENALIKARAFSAAANMPVIADDSGLECDFLGGAPGVFSARYAPGSDKDRVNKLLSDLKNADTRTARFVSVVAMVFPDGKTLTARGECEGIITETPQGENGFGYDPVFFTKVYKKTFAQLTADEKNSISHRGRALKQLSHQLKLLYN